MRLCLANFCLGPATLFLLFLDGMKVSPEIVAVNVRDNYDVISKMMLELHLHEYMLFNKTASWQDIEKTYMRHVIEMFEQCDGLFLIAYITSVPVGFIFGYLEEQDDSRIEIYTGKQLYVSDGYVDAAYRGQGIYRQLNAVMEKYYIDKGVKRITRFTRINNTRMRSFLESAGYEVTRLLYEKWL